MTDDTRAGACDHVTEGFNAWSQETEPIEDTEPTGRPFVSGALLIVVGLLVVVVWTLIALLVTGRHSTSVTVPKQTDTPAPQHISETAPNSPPSLPVDQDARFLALVFQIPGRPNRTQAEMIDSARNFICPRHRQGQTVSEIVDTTSDDEQFSDKVAFVNDAISVYCPD